MKKILCFVLTLALAASVLCVPALAARETITLKGYWNTGFELTMQTETSSRDLHVSSGGRDDVCVYRVARGATVDWSATTAGIDVTNCVLTMTEVRYNRVWGVYEAVPNSKRTYTGSSGRFALNTDGIWAIGVSDELSGVAGWDVDMREASLVLFVVGTTEVDTGGSNEVVFSTYATHSNGAPGDIFDLTLTFSGLVTRYDDYTAGYSVISVPLGSELYIPGADFTLTHVYYADGVEAAADAVELESYTTASTVSFRLDREGYFRLEGRSEDGDPYSFGPKVLLNVANTAEKPPVPVTYVVQKGDTLAKIAAKLYGDSSKWQLILEANKSRIQRPDMISTGMVLLIPAETDTEMTDGIITPPADTAPKDTANGRTYVVRKGDTLRKIAETELGNWRLWTVLYDANKETLKNTNLIYPGQVIIIPVL